MSYEHWLIMLLCISPSLNTCISSLLIQTIRSPSQTNNGGDTEGQEVSILIPALSDDWKVDCDWKVISSNPHAET